MKPVVLNSLRVLRAAIDDLRAPRRVASGTMHSQQRSDHLYVRWRVDGACTERRMWHDPGGRKRRRTRYGHCVEVR